jgi:hypothetical protein
MDCDNRARDRFLSLVGVRISSNSYRSRRLWPFEIFLKKHLSAVSRFGTMKTESARSAFSIFTRRLFRQIVGSSPCPTRDLIATILYVILAFSARDEELVNKTQSDMSICRSHVSHIDFCAFVWSVCLGAERVIGVIGGTASDRIASETLWSIGHRW